MATNPHAAPWSKVRGRPATIDVQKSTPRDKSRSRTPQRSWRLGSATEFEIRENRLTKIIKDLQDLRVQFESTVAQERRDRWNLKGPDSEQRSYKDLLLRVDGLVPDIAKTVTEAEACLTDVKTQRSKPDFFDGPIFGLETGVKRIQGTIDNIMLRISGHEGALAERRADSASDSTRGLNGAQRMKNNTHVPIECEIYGQPPVLKSRSQALPKGGNMGNPSIKREPGSR